MLAHAHLNLAFAHVRGLVAFLRCVPGPIVFPKPGPSGPVPSCAVASQVGMFVVAVGGTSAQVTQQDVDSLRGSHRDAVLMRLGEPFSDNAFQFDIVLAKGGRLNDMRLHVSATGACRFVPADGVGDILHFTRTGLVRMPEPPGRGPFDHVIGRGRATAEMTMLVHGSRIVVGERTP